MVIRDIAIYIIFDKEDHSRMYIGSTLNYKRRIGEHFSRLRKGNHHSKKLQNFVNKHGIDRLGYCKLYNCVEEVLEESEYYEIMLNNSASRTGFNMTSEHNRMSEDSRKIVSEKAKIRQSTPEVKLKLKLQNSGINNPSSKLSLEDVKYIKDNFIRISKRKSNMKKLAELFNVSRETINRIVLNQTYIINEEY